VVASSSSAVADRRREFQVAVSSRSPSCPPSASHRSPPLARAAERCRHRPRHGGRQLQHYLVISLLMFLV
jgi:hypothetical protein